MTLLSVGSDSKRVIVSPIRFVIDERCLICSRQISGFPVVVTSTIEELTFSIGERLRELLTPYINVRIEVDMPEAHSSSESETQSDSPNIVVTRNVIEKTLQASPDGPLKQHWIRCSSEQQETPVSEPLN